MFSLSSLWTNPDGINHDANTTFASDTANKSFPDQMSRKAPRLEQINSNSKFPGKSSAHVSTVVPKFSHVYSEQFVRAQSYHVPSRPKILRNRVDFRQAISVIISLHLTRCKSYKFPKDGCNGQPRQRVEAERSPGMSN